MHAVQYGETLGSIIKTNLRAQLRYLCDEIFDSFIGSLLALKNQFRVLMLRLILGVITLLEIGDQICNRVLLLVRQILGPISRAAV